MIEFLMEMWYNGGQNETYTGEYIMIETYYLNKEQLPTIPTPHDAVITDIKIENQSIVFKFEDDIGYYDSIKAVHPDAKSLIIKYHLVDEDSFSVYKWHKPVKFFASNGYH